MWHCPVWSASWMVQNAYDNFCIVKSEGKSILLILSDDFCVAFAS